MLNVLRKLWKEESGQGLTEYGLILGIVAIAVIGVLIAMKDKLLAVFNSINNGLGTNTTPSS